MKKLNKKKMIKRKKMQNIFDITWRILGWCILILFVLSMVLISKGITNNTLSAIVIVSLITYAVVSLIIFLPRMIKEFWEKVRKRRK